MSMKDGTLELRKFFQGTPQNRNVCYAQSPPSVLVKGPPGVKLRKEPIPHMFSVQRV